MNKSYALLLVAICSSLFFPFCKKDKYDLYSPPEGNKLTCRINGMKWSATEIDAGFSLDPPDTYYFRLWATNNNKNETVEIYFNKPYSQQKRVFNQNTESWYYTLYPKDYGYFHRNGEFGNSETYMTNSIDTGYCNITYMDSVKLWIKGVFAFKARDPVTNKTITITDGYFERVQ
ncbi:MAG: hypothetical protein JNK14_06150 [Chitinophagaceae bacterium]|nr:hypothetical protein [Chitinophagaceae bacterium]